MPDFMVSAATRINRPIEEVVSTIGDFNTWSHWSPWLCLEPEATVESYGEASTLGHGYRWEGKKVGSGEMVWKDILPTQLYANLTFLKPFKSQAKVGFLLTEVDGGTEVEWVMDSSLPFYLFFMVKVMKGMITMDYSRGLAQLKDYIETGDVSFSMEAKGIVDVPSVHYLGVSNSTSMSEMNESMGSTFGELMQRVESAGLTISGEPLAVYNKMSIARGQCDYTAAIPVGEALAVDRDGLNAGVVNAGKAYKVVHRGPYRHLGNSWALAMSDVRHLKLKTLKSQKPFERYINDPANTPEKDLVTEILVPVR